MIRSALWAENERSWGFSTEAGGERAKLSLLHLKSETFVLANLVTFGLLAQRPSTPRSSDVCCFHHASLVLEACLHTAGANVAAD